MDVRQGPKDGSCFPLSCSLRLWFPPFTAAPLKWHLPFPHQIVLPPSIGAALMSMDAPKNGAMMFELATSSGRTTHAGVLEFTAPEGQVHLPRKVVRCLWGREVRMPYRQTCNANLLPLLPS